MTEVENYGIPDGLGFSWPFGRKRRACLAASIARQQELDEFWKAEQIRLKPNMAHLLSGASFEKVKGWTDSAIEQLLASAERGICRLLDGSRQMPQPFLRIPNKSTICEVYK